MEILKIQTAFAQSGGEGGAGIASKTGDQLQSLFETVVHSIPLWITGGIVIIFSFVLARIVKNTVENRMSARGFEEEHHEIQIVAGRAASAIVLTIGITAALKIAGLDLTPIIAAAAFGIGFAMQDIIMNFLAGIIVLLQKQFTIGDWIKVKGTEGIVQEIQSRYTIIKKFDGTKVIIPNADLFKNQVNNLTGNPSRRFKINIGVDLYADLKEVIELIYESIGKVDQILQKPKPSIIVTQPGPFYNNLRIRCWVDSRKGILRPISALMRQIHKDFYRKGWSWPYPTQTLIFDKDAPPDVNHRARDYIEKHKKALKEEDGLIKQRQQIMAEGQFETQIEPKADNQPVNNQADSAQNAQQAKSIVEQQNTPIANPLPSPLVVTVSPEIKTFEKQ